MANKTRILQISNSLSNGGLERVVSNLTFCFDTEEVYQKVIIYEDSNIQYEYNGDVEYVPELRLKKQFATIKDMMKRRRYLKKKGNNFDYIITHHIVDSIGSVFVRKKSYKSVVVLHSSLDNILGGNFLKRFLIRKMIKKADKVICVSKGITNDVHKINGVKVDRVYTIYNPFRIKSIAAENKLSLFNADHFNLVHVGRLTYAKAQWKLIHIIMQLKEYIPNVILHIVGEGELRDDINNAIIKHSLQKHIMLHGFRKNVYDYLYSADFFLLTSIHEGFGNVLVESLAVGTPVISSNCKSGPQEIICPSLDFNEIVNENIFTNVGVLVPFFKNIEMNFYDDFDNDVEQYVEAIIKARGCKFNSEELLERALCFDIDNVKHEWFKIFELNIG